MTNARIEFEEHTKDKVVKCAMVYKQESYWEDGPKILLPVGYNLVQYENFLDQLNFTYDSGYGGQELFGIIWYEDGSWSERGEYDGSEWWEHNELPEIPEELKDDN